MVSARPGNKSACGYAEARAEASSSERAGGARLRQGYGASAVARRKASERRLEGPGASAKK